VAVSSVECQECQKIARAIAEAVARILRADDDAARQEAARRRLEVLKARQQHEVRTGHRVPA
jgi:hypothetical protein